MVGPWVIFRMESPSEAMAIATATPAMITCACIGGTKNVILFSNELLVEVTGALGVVDSFVLAAVWSVVGV